jgi:peptidoglycan/LPS O-acetylase OafA/YrhL
MLHLELFEMLHWPRIASMTHGDIVTTDATVRSFHTESGKEVSTMPKGHSGLHSKGVQSDQSHRLSFLDGIRGWGALVVVFYHVFVDAVPIDPLSRKVLCRIVLFNGPLAVWCFFIASGFSLSIGYLSKLDKSVLKRIFLARYLRLTIPIAAACFLVYVLCVCNLIPPVGSRPGRLNEFLIHWPSLFETARFSFFGVYFNYNPSSTLDPPLWTMPIELAGSMIVLALLAFSGRRKSRVYIYTATLFFLCAIHFENLAAFVVGLLLAEVYSGRLRSVYIRNVTISRYWLVPIVLAAFFFPYPGSPFQLIDGTVIVICAAFCDWFKQILSSPLSKFLGGISFALYVTHSPVLWALGRLSLFSNQPAFQAVLVRIGFVAVAIGIAFIFAPIDRFSVRASRSFSDKSLMLLQKVRIKTIS